MPPSVTLKAVAARAGVSYQTVSKVLNGQVKVSPATAERILTAARELGYRTNQIARSMRTQRSRSIGYSWEPSQPGQVNTILDAFLSSMVSEAEDAGYYLLPFLYRAGDAQVETYRELIDSGRVDGFVLSSLNYDDPRVTFLLERGFPFVAFGRSNPGLDFPSVDVDSANGVRQAVTYLASTGHRRIAVIGWPSGSRVGSERLQGYRAALQDAGLESRPEWVLNGEGSFEFGFQAAARLLDLPAPLRPSAVLAFNDTAAIGALHAVQARGLAAGRDLAVIGFDDAPMSQYLIPPLTTLRQPVREAGRLCVEILVALLEGREPERRQVLLPPQLIIRESA